MPELPNMVREKFVSRGIPNYQAGLLTSSREMAEYAEAACTGMKSAVLPDLANWLTGPLSGKLNEEKLEITESRVSPKQLQALEERIDDGTLTNKLAREVFDAMWAGEGDVDAIIAKRGLKQISDSGELERVCDQVIAANAQQVADYKGGKDKAFNSLVGQVMKLTKGKANPQQVTEILKRKLSG